MNPIDFSNKKIFIAELMKINDIVNDLNPKCQKADYWAISDGGAEYISIHKPDHDENYPLEYGNWSEIRKIYPYIDKLMDDLNLHRFLGKINSAVWPIHRHIYNTSSICSLTVFANNVDNTRLSFYDLSDRTEYSEKFIYDTKSYDCADTPELQVNIKSQEIYCIDTWVWHSYQVNGYTDVFLLYPKNISNSLEKAKYIDFLKTR